MALSALLTIYALARFLQVFPGRFPTLAVVALHVIPPALFALLHGAVRIGWRGILVFFGICLAVGGVMENLGVLTGLPFGRYYFTGLMGPRLWLVPILLSFAYVGMGYLAWTLATLILHGIWRPIMTPLIATFIMVAWDFSMEPVWSIVLHAWIWLDGGLYFGVPISNFFGWFLTAYLIFQSFAFYLRRHPVATLPLPRNHQRLAVLFYAVTAAGKLLFLLPHHGPTVVTDPTGVPWRAAYILAATALVSLFLMGAFTLLAWSRRDLSEAICASLSIPKL